jgi:enediyne biosynthesis protein E4
VDFADYNNDGLPDAFVNALSNQRYALFKQVEKTFEYVSGPTGVGRASTLHSGWRARLIDYDNDGESFSRVHHIRSSCRSLLEYWDWSFRLP